MPIPEPRTIVRGFSRASLRTTLSGSLRACWQVVGESSRDSSMILSRNVGDRGELPIPEPLPIPLEHPSRNHCPSRSRTHPRLKPTHPIKLPIPYFHPSHKTTHPGKNHPSLALSVFRVPPRETRFSKCGGPDFMNPGGPIFRCQGD